MNEREALKLALEALEDTLSGDLTPYQAAKTISAIKEALAQPEPPPECKTEEEKTAFAFGWFKAMESHRVAQQSNEQVEPFGWGRIDLGAKMFYDDKPMLSDGKTFPLYTHPPVPYVVEPRTAQREPTKKEHDVLMGALKRSSKVVDNGQTKEPEQSTPHGEPVAWFNPENFTRTASQKTEIEYAPLYTTPPQRKPLTDEKLIEMFGNGINGKVFHEIARMTEAAHDIKE